jgi:hypothetical protein
MSVALFFAAWEAAVDAFEAARVTVVCRQNFSIPAT